MLETSAVAEWVGRRIFRGFLPLPRHLDIWEGTPELGEDALKCMLLKLG